MKKYVFIILFLALLMPFATALLSDDLVSWYSCDGILGNHFNSTIYVADSTGLNNMSVTGALLMSSGIRNTACYDSVVSGGDGYAYKSSFIGLNITGEFTICAWNNLSDTMNEAIFDYRQSATRFYALHTTEYGGPPDIKYGGYEWGTGEAYSGRYPYNSWHHVCWSYSYPNNESRLRVNGITQMVLGAYSNPADMTGTAYLMFYPDMGLPFGYTAGSVDEVGVWNRTLSSDEVWSLYTNQYNYSELFNGSNPSINQINNSYFSDNQCVYDGNHAYLCNESVYNPSNNGWYCDIDNIQLCQYGCIQTIADINTSEFAFKRYGKTCEETQTSYQVLELNCSTFTDLWYSLMYNNPYYHESIEGCNIFDTYNMPTTLCTTDEALQIVWDNPKDIFYTGGECLLANCTNKCTTEGLYSCFNDYWQQKCVINPQTGCLFHNLTQQCAPGDVCRSGSCINQAIVNNNYTNIPPGTQTPEATNLWGGIFGDMANSSQGQLLIAIIMIIVSLLFSGGFIIVTKIATGSEVPGILSTIIFIAITGVTTAYFIVIGFIPFWILLILVILIAFAIGAWIRNKAVGAGG